MYSISRNAQALLLQVVFEILKSQPALLSGVVLPPKKDSQLLLVKLHEASIAMSQGFSRSSSGESLFWQLLMYLDRWPTRSVVPLTRQ